MNFGSAFTPRSVLLEAPGDDANAQGQDAQTNAPADNGADANANADTGANDNGGGDDTANEDDANFDIDASDDIQDDGNTGGENTTDSGSGDATSFSGGNSSGSSAGEANVDTPAKKKDREIFDTLSPEEQKLKTVKLKQLYMDLYSRCDQIIQKYNSLGVEYEDLIEPIHKSLDALYSLKDAVSNYLLYLFDSKSYIENDIMFNRFLTAMNQIKLITKDMRDTHKQEIEDVKNDTPLNDKDIEKEKNQN